MCFSAVVPLGNASSSDAAVGVRSKDAAVLVHGNVIEVQKVSRSVGASSSLRTDHAELYGVARRGIHSEPTAAAVVSGSDVAMPHAIKRSASVRAGGVACRGGAEEEVRRTVVVASGDFWKSCIVNCEKHADIQIVTPGAALVVRNGNVWMTVAANVAKVNAPLGTNAHC